MANTGPVGTNIIPADVQYGAFKGQIWGLQRPVWINMSNMRPVKRICVWINIWMQLSNMGPAETNTGPVDTNLEALTTNMDPVDDQ